MDHKAPVSQVQPRKQEQKISKSHTLHSIALISTPVHTSLKKTDFNEHKNVFFLPFNNRNEK